MHLRGKVLGFIALLLIMAGCALSKRGMLSDNTYFSNRSPNILIKVNPKYTYQEGKQAYSRHSFFNEKERRIVSLEHHKFTVIDNRIDYWEETSTWIFSNISDSTKIDTGSFRLLQKKWFFCNYFKSNEKWCAIVRTIRRFTSYQDLFSINYIAILPPVECERWENRKHLTDKQKRFLTDLVEDFNNDTEITPYFE